MPPNKCAKFIKPKTNHFWNIVYYVQQGVSILFSMAVRSIMSAKFRAKACRNKPATLNQQTSGNEKIKNF